MMIYWLSTFKDLISQLQVQIKKAFIYYLRILNIVGLLGIVVGIGSHHFRVHVVFLRPYSHCYRLLDSLVV